MFDPIDADDKALIAKAADTLHKRYREGRHGVAAAVLCGSGKVYGGVNVEACGYGPCAEAVAMGTAFTAGETEVLACVAVCKEGDEYPVLSPCGNCRQMLIDYAPDASVILSVDGQAVKTTARNLLPGPYLSDF